LGNLLPGLIERVIPHLFIEVKYLAYSITYDDISTWCICWAMQRHLSSWHDECHIVTCG